MQKNSSTFTSQLTRMQKAETNPGLSRDTRKPMEIVDCRRYVLQTRSGYDNKQICFYLYLHSTSKKEEKKRRKNNIHTRACTHTQPPFTVIHTLSAHTQNQQPIMYNMYKSTNGTGMYLRGVYTKHSSSA